MLNQRRAQSSLEYSLIIMAAVAALLTMQVYMKRSIIGRLKASSSQLGDHFEPQNVSYNRTTFIIKSEITTTEHHPEDNDVMTTIEYGRDTPVGKVREETCWEEEDKWGSNPPALPNRK